MTIPEGRRLGDDAPEADVIEQRTAATADEADDRWQDAAGATLARDWDADEADVIEQTLSVPEDDEFDR